MHDDMLKTTLLWTRQYILRLVLNTSSTSQPVLHHFLKKATFSHAPSTSDTFPIKCAFDVALVSLLDDGLLTRCGYGNWAQYTVPKDAVKKAMRVAYADFTPDWFEYSYGFVGDEGEEDDMMAMAAVAAAEDACDVAVREYGGGGRSPRRVGKRDRYGISALTKGKIGNSVSYSVSKKLSHHKRRKMQSPSSLAGSVFLNKETHVQPMSP